MDVSQLPNGHKPCTGCGQPRDWARKNGSGVVVAHCRCRACHASDTMAYLHSRPERLAKQRAQSKRWYKTITEDAHERVKRIKREWWHRNKHFYKAGPPPKEIEGPAPAITFCNLSGSKFERAVNNLLRGTK